MFSSAFSLSSLPSALKNEYRAWLSVVHVPEVGNGHPVSQMYDHMIIHWRWYIISDGLRLGGKRNLSATAVQCLTCFAVFIPCPLRPAGK